MLNRDDYEMVAETLRGVLGKGEIEEDAYHKVAYALGEAFAEQNPRFNFATWENIIRTGKR